MPTREKIGRGSGPAGGSRYSPFLLLRRVYDWVVALADRPDALWALFLLAAAEASFFPVPPDVLLITLAVGAPRKAFRMAAVCTAGSLVGAVVGYLLGYQFYEWVGRPIVDFYAAGDSYLRVQQLYQKWDALAVAVAGFTPIPFKVFTIAAGAFRINFPVFLLAAAASRSARFFLVGGLIYRFGPGIQKLINRYFNWLTILFAILLVAGFVLLKTVL